MTRHGFSSKASGTDLPPPPEEREEAKRREKQESLKSVCDHHAGVGVAWNGVS